MKKSMSRALSFALAAMMILGIFSPLPTLAAIPDGAVACSGSFNRIDLGTGNTGNVEVTFVLVPLMRASTSDDNAAGAMNFGFSSGNQSNIWGVAAAVKLSSEGFFDTWDYYFDDLEAGGMVYWWRYWHLEDATPDEELPNYAARYAVGKHYQMRIVINTVDKKYSTFVTALDEDLDPLGTEICVGDNASFRSGMSINNVRYLYLQGPADSYYIMNHAVRTVEPEEKYSVTVNNSYSTNRGAGMYVEGDEVTVDAGSRDGLRFAGWTVSGVTLPSKNTATVTFTMPANAVTLRANWESSAPLSSEPPAGYNPPDLPAGYTALTEWPDASSAGLVGYTKDTLPNERLGEARSDTFTSDKTPNLEHGDNILVDGAYTTPRLPYAPIVIDTDNTVIENTRIKGGLIINAKNVIIRNCYIEAQHAFQGGQHANATGVIVIEPDASASIINCEINGMEGVHAGIWNKGESMVAVGNSIYGSDDGIFHWTDENSQYTGKTGNNFRVQDNWIHDLTDTTSNGHIDGWQTTAASNGIIKNNYFDLPLASSGNFALYGGWAPSRYIMIEGNLFQGSGYTIYCYSNNPGKGPVENIWFKDNAFSTKHKNICGNYGIWFPNNEPCDSWFNEPGTWGTFRSGNYYWNPETGKAIRSADPQPLPEIPDDAWVCAGNGATFAAGKHDLGEDNTGVVQTQFVLVPLADYANSGVGYTSNGSSTGWGQMSYCLMLNSEGFFDIYQLMPDEDKPGEFTKWWKLYYLKSTMSDDELPPGAVRYEVGKPYQIRMVMDIDQGVYSVYVTRLDNDLNPIGDEVCIGTDGIVRASGTDVRYFYTSPGTKDTYYVINHEVGFNVSVNGSYAADSGAGLYTAGDTVTINAGTRSGYTFAGWTATGITLSNASNVTDTFAMPANDVTLTANWTAIPAPPPVPTPTPSPEPSAVGADVTVTDDGKAVAEVEKESLAAAIQQSEQQDDAIITIQVEAPEGAENIQDITLAIPEDLFAGIANANADLAINVPISGDTIGIAFDNDAVDSIFGNEGNVEVSISVLGNATLSESIQDIVKDRPVYDFSVRVGDKDVHSFGSGKVTVEIPYTLKPGENPNAIIVYYLNNDNELEIIRGFFDEAKGVVVFITDHFSMFVIDYNQVSWVDVTNDTPHKDAIDFISARGITIGVGKGKFDPNGELTRAQLLVMIMRAYGITDDTPYESNFDDVAGTGVWYESWVGIAKDMGITLGVGNNKFGEAPVTHAQALLFMHRTLQALGENLTPVDGGKTLADYDDADELPSWALSEIDAFEQLVAAGIYDEEALKPNNSAIRALMAQLIYNLLTR